MAVRGLVVLYETPAVTVGVLGPYCLGRWRDVPDAAGLEEMHRALLQWASSGRVFAAINVVDVRAVVDIPRDAQKVIARIQSSFDRQQVALATVLPTKGYVAAAVRGIVAVMSLMSDARFEQEVFDAVLPAARWCARALGRSELDQEADAISVAAALASLEHAPKPVRMAE